MCARENIPCNDGVTRITDIVDNRAAEGFVAEHGLSLLIEHGDERILFDTGAGAGLRPNAAKLGIDFDGMTRIVLSHSHNDHMGGLGGLAPKCPIHVGDGFDMPCFSKHADGSVHSLAVPHIAIRTIVGGLHLCHATDEEIAQTGDFLRQQNLDRLVLLHCTGEAAGAKLKETLSRPVVWGSAGSILIGR